MAKAFYVDLIGPLSGYYFKVMAKDEYQVKTWLAKNYGTTGNIGYAGIKEQDEMDCFRIGEDRVIDHGVDLTK